MQVATLFTVLARLLRDERGIVGGGAAIGGIAQAIPGTLSTLFDIGSKVTGLFGGGPESEILKTLEGSITGAHNRGRQIQGLGAPFVQLAFQSAANQLGLQPGGFNLGQLGLNIPSVVDFLDPREAKKVVKSQDKITKLQNKKNRRLAAGKGTGKFDLKIKKLQDEIAGFTEGVGLPEDALQQIEDIEGGLVNLFDSTIAPQAEGLADAREATLRQIEQSVPPGGLRDQLLAEANENFNRQTGLLELQDFNLLRDFALGRIGSAENQAANTLGLGPSLANTQLQGELAGLSNLAGLGQSLGGGIGGIEEFLSQFGGAPTAPTFQGGIAPGQFSGGFSAVPFANQPGTLPGADISSIIGI